MNSYSLLNRWRESGKKLCTTLAMFRIGKIPTIEMTANRFISIRIMLLHINAWSLAVHYVMNNDYCSHVSSTTTWKFNIVSFKRWSKCSICYPCNVTITNYLVYCNVSLNQVYPEQVVGILDIIVTLLLLRQQVQYRIDWGLMNIIKKYFTLVWRDNGETDRVSVCRDGTRIQRSTVLRLFRVIKRCVFRETNEFLFLVPSPIINLGCLFFLILRKV